MSKEIEAAAGARRDALLAVRAALRAADPRAMVRSALRLEGGSLRAGVRTVYLGDRRVFVVGAGKASALMAVELEKVLGRRVSGGVVIAPDYQRRLPKFRRIEVVRSTHPLPSQMGVRATRRMLEFLDDATRTDLVVCLISGGGSSLMALPVDGVTVGDLALTTRLLQNAGAGVTELNCVRRHLSKVAGGRLAELAGGAEVLSLIVSDVVGDDVSSIASGPTAPDPTTFAQAKAVLRTRRVWRKVPPRVRKELSAGAKGERSETPKPGDPCFRHVANVLIGANSTSIVRAKSYLENRGYPVPSFLGSVTGEARVVGRRLALLAKAQRRVPWAAVWGGETTVTIRGNGTGGRNQELVLSAAISLAGSKGITVASFGTDGIDGASDAAGAIADSSTVERARALGFDPVEALKDNDSYHFFKPLGDLLVTGPTGTNVNDVMVALKRRD